MAKRGGKKGSKRAKGPAKIAKKKVKKPVKISRKVRKAGKIARKRIIKVKAVKPIEPAKPVVEEAPAEEKRVLKKLPPAKPLKLDRQVMRVFGHEIDPRKVKAAAMEAYNKRGYCIDDIPVESFIKDGEWDNLMTKIGILDRIEEQLNLMYPHIDVVRKNKITIELYLRE